jgi:predicted nucleotidyltransferase
MNKKPFTLDDLQAYREQILSLSDRYGAYNVRVFGSVARNQAQSGSDVDFLVTTQQGVSLFDIVGLWLDLKALLGCEVSLVTDGIQDREFLQRIQYDAVAL